MPGWPEIPRWPDPPGGFVPDPDFMTGLTQVVRVEVNVNADGQEVDTEGGPGPPQWRVVTGLEAVRCLIAEVNSRDLEVEWGVGITAAATVLFGSPIQLDRRHRLVYQDPDSGREEFWFVLGKSRVSTSVRHHWTVDVTNRYI